MRFGYAFHGFLSDRKIENGVEVSSPDGCAAYSWSILWEAQRRGWRTFLLQRDRDREAFVEHGLYAFSSFSRDKRSSAYCNATSLNPEMPLDDLSDLDVVLMEWRWPIPGRNTEDDRGTPTYQPDLDRQTQLLEHFKDRGTKVILWDMDHKLTLEDEVRWEPDAIFETAVSPRDFGMERTRVEPPIVIDDLYQHPTVDVNRSRKMVYVGSRYERDDVIDEWIKPVSERWPFQVEFWGNWTREPNLTECREKWPNILYNRRIGMADFLEVYSTAVCCPILGKRSYLESGFMTPRIWEALLFGTIPVGIDPHLEVRGYVNYVARDPQDLCEIVTTLSHMSTLQRDRARKFNIEKIRFMDVRHFIDEIEDVVNG